MRSDVARDEMPKPRSRRPLDFALMTPATRVVEELLGLVANDRLVVVHDRANVELALAFEHAAVERQAKVTCLDWQELASRPWTACHPTIERALSQCTTSILCISNEEGEYDARHGLVAAATRARARHVHMVGTSRLAFLAATSASSARIFSLTRDIRLAMRPTSRISARSVSGTRLEVEMAPHLRWFSNGDAVRPGQWINVPFGALVTTPYLASGVFAADAAVGGGTGARAGLLARKPIKLTFDGGRLKSVDCNDVALKRYVEGFAASGPNRDRLGLVSLGTNLGILTPLGEIIHDENLPGIHVALGEPFPAQSGATWTAHGQLAFASASSDVDLDGTPLIRLGRYVRFV
jgi:leucyl aminopeptidase (aminopeptidase T)